jgi:hypothetical protein
MSYANVVAIERLAVAMHCNRADERDHEAFRRIAIVLLTLSAIAEKVSGRSVVVRGIILWLLCRAEARASDFAVRTGAATGLGFLPAVLPVGGSGEAVRLAQAFRALAAVFFALSRRAPQWLRMVRRHHLIRQSANLWNRVQPSSRHAVHRPRCIDTS